MNKISSALIIVVCLVLAGVGRVSAASNKCRVVEVEDKRLVLECERDASRFNVDDQVKIKTVRKGAAVEGC
ncbi:MAG: hypothetical protein P8X86_10115 [Desulfofustis sp.]